MDNHIITNPKEGFDDRFIEWDRGFIKRKNWFEEAQVFLKTYFKEHVISNSEYLVRNQVQAANQQDLVLQGVKCVLCKGCSVYCTGCAM